MYDFQHGFHKNSCETQLVMLMEECQCKQTELVLLDFLKAFDTVNHSKLLWKLHNYDLSVQTLGRIRAFLGSRSQWVVVDGEEPESTPVTTDVPLGSVLEPILFLIYIKNLTAEVCSQVRLFADDTALYLTVKNENDNATL